MTTAQEVMTANLSGFSLVRRTLAQLAGLGLLLSVVGIYGVIANLAMERTQEVGIRMALGAQARDVIWLFLRNGIFLALLGTAIGMLSSFGLMRILNRMVAILPGNDPWVVVGLAALLGGVAIIACWLPARRATKVNPVVALRAE
jgi:ABC-type antimicrobial peptide transport system permease subunit